MHKYMLYENENFALWKVTEILVVDEGDCYETSYPYDEILNVEELFGNKVRVTYYYKQPVLTQKISFKR